MWWFLSRPMIYDSPFSSEYEKFIVKFETIDFIDVSMNSCDFFNVMILSGLIIYDSPITSEYENYIVNFEMIAFIEVSTNSCNFS